MSKEAYKQNETKTKKMKRRVKVKLERKEKTKNKKETNNKSKQNRNKHTNKQTKLGLSKEVALLYIPNQSKLSINQGSYLIQQRYPVRLTSYLLL